MYQAVYKCRLCGEEFSPTKGIDISDERFSDCIKWHFRQMPTVKTEHNCQDGSIGLADFQGFKKAED